MKSLFTRSKRSTLLIAAVTVCAVVIPLSVYLVTALRKKKAVGKIADTE